MPTDLPDLLVLADGRTDGGNRHAGRRLARCSAAADYDVTARFTPPDDRRITSVAPLDDGCVVALTPPHESLPHFEPSDAGERTNPVTRLVALDDSLGVRATRDVSRRLTLAATDGTVHAAHPDGFETYDATLDPTGSASLPDRFACGHVEHVLVHDGVAHVVDDVLVPRYLFRVDVSDPASPAYLEVIGDEATNLTLAQQWVDPPADRWCCLRGTSHMSGGEQGLIVTPLAGAPAAETVSHEGDRIDVREGSAVETVTLSAFDRSETDDEAWEAPVVDVTHSPPTYAVVRDEGCALAAVGDDARTFDPVAGLDGPARVVSDGTSVVALAGSGRVRAYDTDAGTVVHDATVDVSDPLALWAAG